jgi:hypothetical protein
MFPESQFGHAGAVPVARSRALLTCGGAAVLAAVVYLNALGNPFVYDDYRTVVANTSIHDLSNLRAIALYDMTRPLVNLSYALDRALWGAGPVGHHVTSVLLHVLVVILLYRLASHLSADWRRLDVGRPAPPTTGLLPFAAAALYAVHPALTEAVGYVSGRSEVLCAALFLSALLCGRRWLRGGGASWGAATVASWASALAAKETAVVFPFVLLVWDALGTDAGAHAARRRLLRVHLPLLAVALGAGLARLAVLTWIEYPDQTVVQWRYGLLALDVVRRYAWLILAPAGQAAFHQVAAIGEPGDPRAILAVVWSGAMVALAWHLRRADRVASFGLVWFMAGLLPSSLLILLDRGEPMAEHRVYVASGGLFLAIGAGIDRLAVWAERSAPGSRPFGAIALGLVLVAFAAQTVQRNRVWSDPVTLWRESVERAPGHYRPRLLLGEALHDAGRLDEAIVQFRTAVELRPTDPTGRVKLGQSLAELGRLDEARRQFLDAIALDPQHASARQSLDLLDAVASGSGTDGLRR